MKTECCRKCTKLACPNRNKVENCKDCISYVWLAMQEIDGKLKLQKESNNDRI